MLHFFLLSFFILALTTGNPVYLISTKNARRVWPVNRGCLLLRGTWSYLRICPTLDFVIAFWIMIAFYTLLTSLFCIFFSLTYSYIWLYYTVIFNLNYSNCQAQGGFKKKWNYLKLESESEAVILYIYIGTLDIELSIICVKDRFPLSEPSSLYLENRQRSS
jgi:hypothetical protein